LSQLGQRRTGSSASRRKRITAISPRSGTTPPITNHSRNELPFDRPITPVAIAKVTAMRM
jgi:hypothetical protein